MAYEAVDPGFVGEVKVCVVPTITSMTTRATGPIAENTHAEIVNGNGGLAHIHPLVLT